MPHRDEFKGGKREEKRTAGLQSANAHVPRIFCERTKWARY